MTDKVTIDLSKEFRHLDYGTYQKYKELYRYLIETGSKFNFNYRNSGHYLPLSVTVERETALLIKLRFG